MYKRILVPLDHSELAEQALPHAVAIAQAMHAQVTLVGVVDVLDHEAAHEAGVTLNWEAQVEALGAYLQALCRRLADEKVRCHGEVLKGDVAGEITRFAEETNCDLIVMATHGRSTRGKWVHGSLADQLVAQSPAPILLVRGEE
jgi:nucleotide-binding universal stress UspA family protein